WVGSLVLLIVITGLVARAGRRWPFLAFGWLWYLGTLVPVIGLVQVGSQAMADRYTYIPSIGLYVMAAWGVPALLQGGARKTVAIAVPAPLALGACAVATAREVRTWKNSETLFERALAVTSGNFVAHNSLGVDLERRGRLDEAIDHFSEAVRLSSG